MGRGDEDDEDEDEEDTSSDDDSYEEELAQLPPAAREEALVQMAMQRMQRAREKGRSDVHLTKGELAALERRRKRLEEEAERKSERRRRREQRIAVPLTHLEPISRKKKGNQTAAPLAHPPRQDSLPRNPSGVNNFAEPQDRQGYPPMGYFPPPAGTRTRPRAGTSGSRPPSRAREDQRLNALDYMQRPGSSAGRHVSDSVAGARPGLGPIEQPWIPNVSPAGSPSRARQVPDPFQFQTAGPRAPLPPGAAAASRRHVSGPAEMAYLAQRRAAAPVAVRSRQGSQQPGLDEETSEEESEEEEDEEEEEEESSSDGVGSGAQIRQMPRRQAPNVIVVEDPEPEEPEPEPEPVRKTAAPVRRKPVGGKRRRR